jgi:hypothetical protein
MAEPDDDLVDYDEEEEVADVTVEKAAAADGKDVKK